MAGVQVEALLKRGVPLWLLVATEELAMEDFLEDLPLLIGVSSSSSFCAAVSR